MDCNQNPADGCEAYVDNDDNNCGHCGNVCASGSSCSANACREPLVSGAGPGTINPPQGEFSGKDSPDWTWNVKASMHSMQTVGRTEVFIAEGTGGIFNGWSGV